ncbi:unnamed protein product [Ambrosiozyma monospora]|uniref:Unnamed protein product n=1 Tax=Ambrosiozyma monospora TaxID=43982 RepID=A0ACB5TPS9_AMBMO|nr:unnamed protein product [Ambrosiozyma monospora]
MSYKSTSQASLFGNNNTRRTQTVEQKVVFSSDEDFSDDSDWSSLSDDSDDDDAQDELHFEKIDNYKQENRNQLKRSLLSGLFLDQMNHSGGSSSSSPIASQHQQPSNHVTQQHQFQSQSQRIKSPNLIYASSSSHVHHNIDPLELNSMHGPRPPNTAKSNVAAMATLSSPPNNPRPLLKKQNSDNHQHQMNRSGSNNTTHAVSKSALSLTSFFANNRRPTGSQEFNGHYDKYHQSNAPATAATLLTTALSTHMFLPTMNMHKQQQQHILPAKEQILLQQQQHAQLRGRTSDRGRAPTHRLPSLSEEVHDGGLSSARRGLDSSSGSNSSDYRQQQQLQQRNHRDGHHKSNSIN